MMVWVVLWHSEITNERGLESIFKNEEEAFAYAKKAAEENRGIYRYSIYKDQVK